MSQPFTIDPDLPRLDVMEIQKLIPHRYPFLMIDRAVNIVAGKSIIGIKNVTNNEPFFVGHFPSHPVMPGVLIVEAMAQSAAVMVWCTRLGESAHGKVVYFMSVDSCKFRKPVTPERCAAISTAPPRRNRGNVWKFEGVAKVDGVESR